ncbi:MAG: ankyrin repeat domain-containing protein [Acidobacteriota bacterium]
MHVKRAIGVVALALCAGRLSSAADGDDVRLVNAIKAGDRATVLALARDRAAVTARAADGTTPLHWAVQVDALDLVEVLLGAGASASAANRYGVTPLALAATNGSAAAVEALLKAGADANASLPEGQTVLMTAARTGNADTIDALLRAGAAVNATESWLGETALMWAAVENHAAAVRRLVDGGADANARSALQAYPPMNYPSTGLVRMAMPKGGWTALMYAARQGSLEAASALAEGGANVNLTDPDRTTALALAMVNSHFDVAAMLLERGADPNIADVTGKAALYAAIDARNEERLFSRPIARRINKVDSLQLVRLLLARGADPNARLTRPLLQKAHNAGDPTLGAGSTAFMRAAKAGDVVAMRLLVEGGADPTLVQANGTTALMIAAGAGQGGGGDDEEVVEGGNAGAAIEAIKLCLDRGADINAANASRDTALHAAAGKGADAVIRFLVEHGASLAAENNQGQTPLDLATGSRRALPTTVALLRELSARPAAQPNH